jgi:hypothetical protein
MALLVAVATSSRKLARVGTISLVVTLLAAVETSAVIGGLVGTIASEVAFLVAAMDTIVSQHRNLTTVE